MGTATVDVNCEVTLMNVMFGAVVQATVREEKKLMVENAKLKKDIEELMKQLLEKEKARGGTVPPGDKSI